MTDPQVVHYFDNPPAAAYDLLLKLMIGQGYVPRTCLLDGRVVLSEMNAGHDPCKGCAGPRKTCHGRPQETA